MNASDADSGGAVQSIPEPVCTWMPVGGGLEGPSLEKVRALAVYDDGTGPALFVGGLFETAGGIIVNNIAKWDGSNWSGLNGGVEMQEGTPSPRVSSMAVYDDGTGPALYVAGVFDSAGGVNANSIAKWDGNEWSPLGEGLGVENPETMIVVDDGSGPALYVADVQEAGGQVVDGIAIWDGSSWSGFEDTPLGAIETMIVHDDGTGPSLYIAGDLWLSLGVDVKNVARWDGDMWQPVGGGLPDIHLADFTTFGFGSGPLLVAVGNAASNDGPAVDHAVTWDGTVWTGLGLVIPGSYNSMNDLIKFDDGLGQALYLVGYGPDIEGITKWKGEIGCSIMPGFNYDPAIVAAHYNDGSGPTLYVGGIFDSIAGVESNLIGRWHCESPPAVAISPKHIRVLPEQNWTDPVAVQVTSPDWPCLLKYVDLDGSLTDAPVYEYSHYWGTVVVSGVEIVPGSSYKMRFVDEFVSSAPHTTTTHSWGDVDGSGTVNLADALQVIQAIEGSGSLLARSAADISPCTPDGNVSLVEALEVILAIEGKTYADTGCPGPCS